MACKILEKSHKQKFNILLPYLFFPFIWSWLFKLYGLAITGQCCFNPYGWTACLLSHFFFLFTFPEPPPTSLSLSPHALPQSGSPEPNTENNQSKVWLIHFHEHVHFKRCFSVGCSHLSCFGIPPFGFAYCAKPVLIQWILTNSFGALGHFLDMYHV